jgi:hypothetical protein
VVVADSEQLIEEAYAMAQSLGRVPRHTFNEMRRLTRGATADAIRHERRQLSETPHSS